MTAKRDALLPSGLKNLNQMVRVIGQNREMLGVLTVLEATKIAKQQSADLYVVAPNAKPPVCRIVDWPKFFREMAERERKP
jgi:translation initiation factor IF-3